MLLVDYHLAKRSKQKKIINKKLGEEYINCQNTTFQKMIKKIRISQKYEELDRKALVC